jgi:hypothetical protein
MLIGFIYLILNILDRTPYIGQTRTKSSEERFKKHKTAARGGRNKTLLYTAMKKDGFEHFTVQTLVRIQCESLAELKQKLDNLEAYFAEQYEAYSRDHVVSYSMINTPGGYNQIPCGTGWGAGRIVGTDERVAIAKRMRERDISEKTRKQISETLINNPREWTQGQRDAVSNRMRDKPRTQAEKDAISNSKKGKKRRPEECAAISKAKKDKPFTDTQRKAQANYNEKRFAELFQRHLGNFIKDSTTERQWRYDMSRKKRDGTLDQKYISILDTTSGFTWSS